jgi:chemotaxis response regulator CheB
VAESEGRPVSVALVEDDDGARARLVASICAEPTMRLAGDWRTGAEALAHLASEAPDVLLVDIGLPDMSGLDHGGSPLSPVIARQVLKRLHARAARTAASNHASRC